MKITIIDWKHQENWFTNELVNAFIKWAQEANSRAEINRHNLIDIEYSHCRWCWYCMWEQVLPRWNCKLNDKAKDIITEWLNADIIVLATPIYEYCVSSTMKKFLERCLPLAKFWIGIVPRMKPIKRKIWVIICSSWAPFPFNHLMWITWYPSFILKKVAKFLWCSETKSIFAWGMGGNEWTKEKYMKKTYELWYNLTK